MKKTRIITAICCFCFFSITSIGQTNEKNNNWLEKHPIDVSFGNAIVGMPFSKIVSKPFQPMFTAGTEFYYKQKEHSDFFQTVKVNYYYAKYSTSAIVLNSEVGYRYIFKPGIYIEGCLGIGYSHLFRPNAIYKMNSEGEYEQVRDYGHPCFMADYAFSLGYDFSKKRETPLSIYLKYGNYTEILYAPDIPALPHNILHLGARFYIHKNK